MYEDLSEREEQTINVVVMKLATPRPCGIRSTQRCKADVFSFHRLASTLAKMASNADISVKAYNFPVLRMNLVVDQQTANGYTLKNSPASKETANRNCNLKINKQNLVA